MKKKTFFIILFSLLTIIMLVPILFYIGYYFYALEFKNNLVKAFNVHTQFYYKDYKIIDFEISSLKKPWKNGAKIAFIKPAFTIGEDNNRVIMKFEKLTFQKAFFEDEIKIHNEDAINFKILNNSVICSDIKEARILVKKPQANEAILQRFILTIEQNNIYCRHRNNKSSNSLLFKAEETENEKLGKFDNLSLNLTNEIALNQEKKMGLILKLVQDQIKIADYNIIIKWNSALSAPEYHIDLNKLHINKNNLYQVDFKGKASIAVSYRVNFKGKIDLNIHNYQNLFQSLNAAGSSNIEGQTELHTSSAERASEPKSDNMTPVKNDVTANIEKLTALLVKNSIIKETDLYATLHGIDGEIYVGDKNINLIISELLATQ